MKKILTLLIACSLMSASIQAGNLYVGPTVLVQRISASNSHFNGIHPRLSLGYEDRLDDGFYLAGEIFAIPTTATLSSSTNSDGVNAKATRNFGLSIIPGIMLSDSALGFLRLGIVNTKFTGPNKTKTGWQTGIGLQTPISSSWNVRGEYIYSKYSSVTGLGSPYSNEIGVGLTYKFV